MIKHFDGADQVSYNPEDLVFPEDTDWAEKMDRLCRDLKMHENRLIEAYCEMFEERGLFCLALQSDPEPGVLRRTTLWTMFKKPLARVDVTYDYEKQSFFVIPYIAKDK